MKTVARMLICLTLIALLTPALAFAEDDYEFETHRRVNAHGDEFMSVALTKDERQLIIGAESGRLIIWGIAERKVVKELNQGSAVHCVAALNDPDVFIAAGGAHGTANERAVIRKWHISTGKSEEFQGLATGSVFTLAVDNEAKLVAAGYGKGEVGIWNMSDGSRVTELKLDASAIGLALKGRELFLTKLPPDLEEGQNSILRVPFDQPNQPITNLTEEKSDHVWADLAVSPDRRFMAGKLRTSSDYLVALIDLTTGRETANFEAHDFAWSARGELILFDSEVASARISIDPRGQVSRTELLKEGRFHPSGAPAKMATPVVSADASKAWEVFQLNAALFELDLNKQTVEQRYSVNGLLYAMDVREGLNLIATGGDDEFVRVRKLSDLSLVKEFRAAPGVPQGVALLADGQHVVFSASSKDSATRISVGNLVTGESRHLFDIEEPFVQVHAAAGGFVYSRNDRIVLANGNGAAIRELKVEGKLGEYAVSANGEWLVAANESDKLFRFEIKTGKRTDVGDQKVESLTRLTITNDGRFVYTTDFHANLKKWDVKTNTVTDLAGIRGQAKTLKLSSDEKEIVVGGNHRDVAVYDSAGERRLYMTLTASDFYVTNVWLGGDRLLFSTDAGVIFDGLIRREAEK